MAKIDVIFPQSFEPGHIELIRAAWEKRLPGHTFATARAEEYTAIELLACDNIPVNPGFLIQLSSPVEQNIGNANFEMNVTADNTDASYRNGQWQ